MGLWDKIIKIGKETFKKVLWIYSASEYGDSKNDNDKIVNDLVQYQNTQNLNNPINNNITSYLILILIVIIILLTFIFCAKIIFKHKVTSNTSIRMSNLNHGESEQITYP